MLRSIFLLILFTLLHYQANSQEFADANEASTSIQNDVSTTEASFVQPRFPGCEEREISQKYKYLCSQKRFVSFLERVIKYPKEAKNKGIQGKVLISFIVEKNGTVSSPKIERSPGGNLEAPCLKAIDIINEDEYLWKPAEINGEPVRSMVEMPVNFSVYYRSIKAKKPLSAVRIPDIMKSYQIDDNGNPIGITMEAVDEDHIYDEVELAPQFRGCSEEDMALIDRYKCSRQKYFAYIKKVIQYPNDALANRIQGVAKIACVIEKDGSISEPKLLRDPGSGLGAEAMRIIDQLKDSIGLWSPGQIGGAPVRTRTELPVRFVLNSEDVSPLLVILSGDKEVLHDCIRIPDISVLEQIDGASIKEIKSSKARIEYGEKGRYGAFLLRLPKGKGRTPSALRKQEEVEAYEMYYKGMQVETDSETRQLELFFDQVSSDATIVVSNFTGRTLSESEVKIGSDIEHQIDLSESKGKLFLISIVQKDLYHSQVVVIE